MSTVTVSTTREHQAEASALWEMVSNFPNAHKYSVRIQSVELLSEEETVTNARRECHSYDGESMTQQVVHWNSDEVSYAYEVQQENPQLGSLTFSFSVKEVDEANCSVTATVTIVANRKLPKQAISRVFEPKFKPGLELQLAAYSYYLKTYLDLDLKRFCTGWKSYTPLTNW